MVAHLEAVTSLAVDPNGLYLMSGSKYISCGLSFCPYHLHVDTIIPFNLLSFGIGHDCSIRLWNLESKTCIQEFTAHRKKFEESIHDVAFHPSKCYIASAGADALAKVFVWCDSSASPSSSLLVNCTTEIQKTRASTNTSCSFVLLKEHREHLLKYSFAICELFSKIKVCSGCCKLSWICEPENFDFPRKRHFHFWVVVIR